jgi:hypothetical protein
MAKPMLHSLRTVLRESYVGHVMCAAFLLNGFEYIGRAFQDPFENVLRQGLAPYAGSRLPLSSWSISGLSVSFHLIAAVISTLLAVGFGRWIMREGKGKLYDETN